MKKNDVFWWMAAPLRTLEQVPVPPAADVVIVGAGYTGLSEPSGSRALAARFRSSIASIPAKAPRRATAELPAATSAQPYRNYASALAISERRLSSRNPGPHARTSIALSLRKRSPAISPLRDASAELLRPATMRSWRAR